MIYFPDTLDTANGNPGALVGGKGMALFRLYNAGIPVAKPACIGTCAYQHFVDRNHLREKINLVLHRKDIKDMRWEEMWDVSLQIQNLFMAGKFPEGLRNELENLAEAYFGRQPLVVRSSAPGEDGISSSFAGLHESYLNIAGSDELVKKIKKVWASLWSDRALLYRQELGLDVGNSAMAVVIQPFVESDVSGVLFSRNPLNPAQLILEAVHGLNQGLVDGLVEPDRWFLDRERKHIVKHEAPALRDFRFVRSVREGIQRQEIPDGLKATEPLSDGQVLEIAALGIRLEHFFGTGQDVEWTLAGGTVYILQSRPITAEAGQDSVDKRSWYLSLNRSYDNLLQLWESIEGKLLPEMDRESAELAETDLEQLSAGALADEIRRRSAINDRWVSVYWEDFIPFAHGARLFGELYNDVVEPEDPFQFVSLLTGQNMLSTSRNRILYECAGMVRRDESIRRLLLEEKAENIENERFQHCLLQLKNSFSMPGAAAGTETVGHEVLVNIIAQYAALKTFPGDHRPPGSNREELEAVFLAKGKDQLPIDPEKLLELARASYRLRDDDNIHIGRIARELERALAHARDRLRKESLSISKDASAEELCLALEHGTSITEDVPAAAGPGDFSAGNKLKARQLLGQPASRGLARGLARVINTADELKDFKKGEILVVDSIDPTMTFFAPLAAGIIERRGGMLIHGAIIAREYGIPCITGVAEATVYIKSGDSVTVDAYLGICTVQRGK